MSDIVNPTVDLFLYDLRESLGDTETEADRRRENFKRKLPANVGKYLSANDDRVEAEYIQLLDQQKLQTEAQFEDPTKRYKGYYYPVYINDAYGLLVECAINDNGNYALQPAKCFAELKEEIQQNRLQGEQPTIGQTWMISGSLPEGSENPEEIAKDCYAALTGDQKGERWIKDLKGQGKLMGGDIFELSQYSLVMKKDATRETPIQEIQENHHVIIIIYPDRETMDKGDYLHHEWMRMFLFRNKVLWNFGQSRLLKHESKDKFSQIEDLESDIEKGLKTGREIDFLNEKVHKMQGSFSRYIESLKALDLIKGMIEINLKNYRKAEIVQNKKALSLKAEAETDIRFFYIFILDFKEDYLEQIIKDKSNLWTAMNLLQEAIKATESTVAVAKVKKDKKFQELLTDIGVGWAVGSFVAEQQPEPEIAYKLSLANMVSVETIQYYRTILTLPVCAAIAAALLFRLVRSMLGRWDVLSGLWDHVGKSR
ncbi:MAG: hypothetical protein AB4352_24385 [Hormoscilla sp.]